ncbi:phage tail protein [Staphylococcus equorum]|uniref:Ig-like domain-containing protein n=1 Tax=Staphylococcus equorum TaxID=246432 RepID=UPI000852AF56|nr:Ig-like domain-containing protein [Staphylococcus equorum]OEK70195.1 phage tail protein [Staphylococcus equorum]
MADTLNIYKGESLVSSSAYAEGTATVIINELEANTDYPKGTYQLSRKNENGESEKVDVPAFKTKPIAVTGVTIAPKTASVDVGSTTKLSSTVAPSTATNKKVTYSSTADNIATVTSDGTVEGVAEGEATITVTTQDGNKTDTSVITVSAVIEPEV